MQHSRELQAQGNRREYDDVSTFALKDLEQHMLLDRRRWVNTSPAAGLADTGAGAGRGGNGSRSRGR